MTAQEYKSFKGVRKENLSANGLILQILVNLLLGRLQKMKNHFDFQIIEKLLAVVDKLLKEQKIFSERKPAVKLYLKIFFPYQYIDDNKLIEK